MFPFTGFPHWTKCLKQENDLLHKNVGNMTLSTDYHPGIPNQQIPVQDQIREKMVPFVFHGTAFKGKMVSF